MAVQGRRLVDRPLERRDPRRDGRATRGHQAPADPQHPLVHAAGGVEVTAPDRGVARREEARRGVDAGRVDLDGEVREPLGDVEVPDGELDERLQPEHGRGGGGVRVRHVLGQRARVDEALGIVGHGGEADLDQPAPVPADLVLLLGDHRDGLTSLSVATHRQAGLCDVEEVRRLRDDAAASPRQLDGIPRGGEHRRGVVGQHVQRHAHPAR